MCVHIKMCIRMYPLAGMKYLFSQGGMEINVVVPLLVFVGVIHAVNSTTAAATCPPVRVHNPPYSFVCLATADYALKQSCGPLVKGWCLHSLTAQGQRKPVGGDEIYATLTSAADVDLGVGHVTDLGDGRYAVLFDQIYGAALLPRSGSVLSVLIQYSCGVGIMAPPSKLSWADNGAVLKMVRPPLHAYASWPIPRIALPPMNKWDAKAYDVIVCVGDSLMEQIYNGAKQMGFQGDFRFKKIQTALTTQSVRASFIDRVRALYTTARTSSTQKIAILVGSGVWDVLESTSYQNHVEFLDHMEAFEILMLALQREYPEADLVWKSMTAMHIQKSGCGREGSFLWKHPVKCIARVKYMSSGRSLLLYRLQTLALKRYTKVKVLEMYNVTYGMANQTKPGDGRHYLETVLGSLWAYLVKT